VASNFNVPPFAGHDRNGPAILDLTETEMSAVTLIPTQAPMTAELTETVDGRDAIEAGIQTSNRKLTAVRTSIDMSIDAIPHDWAKKAGRRQLDGGHHFRAGVVTLLAAGLFIGAFHYAQNADTKNTVTPQTENAGGLKYQRTVPVLRNN